MYFILFYETVDNYVEKRAPYRDEHLANANAAHNRGELFMAGAFDEPADGAALIFKGEDKSPVENFVNNDPYIKAGLIKKWYIRPWTVVIGE